MKDKNGRPLVSPLDHDVLFMDVSRLVSGARQRVSHTVNRELVLLHWEVGTRIRRDVLRCERAEYGQQIIAGLAERLTNEYGRGWGRRNLFSMVQFAELYPDRQIVQSLTAQLTWTHLSVLVAIENSDERAFYTRMCMRQRWSVRELREQKSTSLYRRLLRSNPSDEQLLASLDELPQGSTERLEATFKDPYILDFLGLSDPHTEQQLEVAILDDITSFLLELGSQFCFISRQKRMRVGAKDYHLDLLFFHRGLRRLVAIELKTGPLKPKHKGQMQLYLKWLDRYERHPSEEPPVGLILCTEKCPSLVEILGLEGDDIHVSTYLIERLPTAALGRRIDAMTQRERSD